MYHTWPLVAFTSVFLVAFTGIRKFNFHPACILFLNLGSIEVTNVQNKGGGMKRVL